MPSEWPWFERKFRFDLPVEKFPEILERLRGTPLRVEELTRVLDSELLTGRDGDVWSIQENVGHLGDLEPLWIGRVHDILQGLKVMRAADLTNQKTYEARQNSSSLSALSALFRVLRTEFVDRLDGLSMESWQLGANHPRLNSPMRMIDLCLFVADHDDYHLARMRELKRVHLRDGS